MKYEKRYIKDKTFETLLYFSNFKIKAIISLLRYTGLRPIEILSIKKENLDLETKSILVKIRKKRKLTMKRKFIHKNAIESIKAYLNYFNPEGKWLFPSYYDEEKYYSYINLYEHLKRISKKITINEYIRPYELRRKFALDIYKKSNHDIKLTAQSLNHADLSSVHHYIGILDIEKERNIISSFS